MIEKSLPQAEKVKLPWNFKFKSALIIKYQSLRKVTIFILLALSKINEFLNEDEPILSSMFN